MFQKEKERRRLELLINLNYIVVYQNNGKLKKSQKDIDERIQQQLWKQTQLGIISLDIRIQNKARVIIVETKRSVKHLFRRVSVQTLTVLFFVSCFDILQLPQVIKQEGLRDLV